LYSQFIKGRDMVVQIFAIFVTVIVAIGVCAYQKGFANIINMFSKVFKIQSIPTPGGNAVNEIKNLNSKQKLS